MKRYNINVNGTAYDVTVEEVGGGAPVSAPVAAPVAAPAAAPAPASTGAAGAIKIEAPMNGTIVDVKVSVGDSVQKGTVVAILEAMKMENDIVAATEGTITSIEVAKGATVNTGSLIATMSN